MKILLCTRSKRSFVCPPILSMACVGFLTLVPDTAVAIPSPELVIGSVSSLTQVFAVLFAAVTGAAAVLARRFGLVSKSGCGQTRNTARVMTALLLLVASLGTLNIWQYRAQNFDDLARLQATLIRPAQFDGTNIQDANLKETSFDKQVKSPLAISTEEAGRLLARSQSNGATLFFDVRETAEHRTGSLPGAQHVRFPDFLNSDIPLEGKKVVLFCHTGNRSSEICAELASRGIDCRFISGGIEKWIIEGRAYGSNEVKTLSDLRAVPDYANKDTLLSTQDFQKLQTSTELQIVDTRYPGDFETGHLPGAINIPLRALRTDQLKQRIAQLENKPTVAACYDRRSCFMAQVLGFELSEMGIDFRGRYTTPWDYFVAPKPKAHVEQWLAEQQITPFQMAATKLAEALIWMGNQSHVFLGLLALALLSRTLVLPIAIKSERDQMVTARHADELDALKKTLKNDPTRKARAIQQFYADKGLTPMRNLLALLFLPVMMLGLSATEKAGNAIGGSFLWVQNLGQPDGLYLLPGLFALLACAYLHWAVAKSERQAKLVWLLGGPILFALVFQLSAVGNVYLCFSLVFLLLQRAYVTGALKTVGLLTVKVWRQWQTRSFPHGVVPLAHTDALSASGNKCYRLSVLKKAGVPVPDGVVIQSEAIKTYGGMNGPEKDKFSQIIWRNIGKSPCAVRSSASNEDGTVDSFAGVFESVLEVEQDELRSALDQVVASFSSARAKSYNSESTLNNEGNILVQEMVLSEYAGVLFTQDPTAPGLMMVELVEGCGDDLVSGRKTPQCLRFGRYTQAAANDETGPVDLMPLLALGRQIEDIFGCPQDIEWAYADGTFQIVQSRDITTLAGGSRAELARTQEWQRLFNIYGNADPDTVILEQDEMSEVLPRPTPVSFSLMGQIWAPGGSVDIACRQPGLPYNLTEGRPGHLVNSFGRTFVDCHLKQGMALRLSAAKARHLRKLAVSIIADFREHTIPALEDQMALSRTTDFARLPTTHIIGCIAKLRDQLVRDFYVEAEKINILASFTMREAKALAEKCTDERNRLMNPDLPHAPTALIDSCANLTGDARKSTLMKLMGHRAVFDYELSTPRYSETPNLLWSMLDSATPVKSSKPSGPALSTENAIDLAIAFQDLKEQAKHETLKIVAEIRRGILALAERTQFDDLIFHLEMEEILNLETANLAALKAEAEMRKDRREDLLKLAPRNVTLTLRECESLSSSVSSQRKSDDVALGGTCVSGSHDATGRVFVVQDCTDINERTFDGFEDGDIIVCRMVSPEWLQYVLRSGGVLSEVGGWLSHMAIVAREKKILMHVKCAGLDQLKSGMEITAGTDGTITIAVKEIEEYREIA